MNRYINKYNLSGVLILILFSLIDLIFYLYSSSTLVLVIINIFIGIFLIIFYKFPKVLRIYNIDKESQIAIESYNKIIELNSNDTTAWNNKGTVFAEIGNYHEALKCFEKVLKVDPKDGGAWHNKGVILDNLRKPQEAIEYYDKALTLDPKLKQAKQSGKLILER